MPCAEQFATTAKTQIFFCKKETVLGFAHQGQAFLSGFGQCFAMKQNAEGFLAAPPHPAPKLVELGKAEAFGLFDDHQSGIRHIDTDLDHCRCHE